MSITMKKAIIISIKAILIIFSSMWLLSLVITLDSYKEQIQDLVKKNYDSRIEIRNDIRVSFWPLPHIKLSNIDLYNHSNKIIYTGDISLYITPKAIMSDDLMQNIYRIKISNSKIDFEELVQVLKRDPAHSNRYALPDLVFSNISVNTFKCSGCIKIEHCHLSTTYANDDSKYELQSAILFNHTDYQIESSFIHNRTNKKISAIDVAIHNQNFQANFKSTNENNSDFSTKGKSTLDIKNLKKFSQDVILASEGIKNNNVIDSLSEVGLKINTDFALQNTSLFLENISVDSEEVENFTGSIDFSIAGGDLNIHSFMRANKINLDAFINQDQFVQSDISDIISTALNFTDTHNYLNNSSNTQKINAFMDFNIGIIQFFKQNIVNTQLQLDLIDGAPYISKATLEFPGDGLLNFSGYYSENRFRPKINGNLMISIKNVKDAVSWMTRNTNNEANGIFLLQSDVLRVPHSIRFDNIQVGSDSVLASGSVIILQDTINNTHVRCKMNFNKLDLNRLGFGDNLPDILQIMKDSDDDRTGKTYLKAVDDYKWLRYIKYNINADITSDNIIFQDLKLKNFISSIELAPSILSLNNISFASDKVTLNNSDFEFSVAGSRPQINSSLNFDYISLDTVIPSPINIDYNNLNKQSVNFFSLYNLDGLINFKTKKFTIGSNVTAQNLSAKFNLTNGVISLIDSSAEACNGTIKAIFSVTANESLPIFSFGFSMSNIDPSPILQWMTGIDNMSGYLSTKGSIRSLGADWETIIKRLNGTVEVIGKEINWHGFDLEKMITSNTLNLSIKDRLYTADYYSKYGNTVFSDLKASIDINGPVANIKECSLMTAQASGSLAANYDFKDKSAQALVKYAFISSANSTPLSIEFQGDGNLNNMKGAWNLDQLNTLISNTPSSQ